MKAGVNRTDLAQVKALFAQGETAEFISSKLQIDLSVIQSFAPKEPDETEEPEVKQKTAKSKLADSATG